MTAFWLVVLLVGIGTATWVGYDSAAAERAAGRSPWLNITGSWVVGCLVLWIVFFPLYLVRRNRRLRRAVRVPLDGDEGWSALFDPPEV
jgi:uncharacterized BrkB/YihY/UPF0761 family membrane protein